jgi:alkylmercury lyase
MANNVAAEEALEAAWRDVFVQLKPSFDLVGALLKLTDVGAHPIRIDDLARTLGRNADETKRLIDALAWPWLKAVTEDGRARVELVSSDPKPRYRYRIGDRIIPVGGCAPDAFLAAHMLRRPMEVESTCPSTGAPIRIEFRDDGTVSVEPPTAVVAVIDPRTAPEALTFTDADRIDADICRRQPLFASSDAARKWLDHHPGGQVLTVSRAQELLKRLMALIGGSTSDAEN